MDLSSSKFLRPGTTSINHLIHQTDAAYPGLGGSKNIFTATRPCQIIDFHIMYKEYDNSNDRDAFWAIFHKPDNVNEGTFNFVTVDPNTNANITNIWTKTDQLIAFGYLLANANGAAEITGSAISTFNELILSHPIIMQSGDEIRWAFIQEGSATGDNQFIMMLSFNVENI